MDIPERISWSRPQALPGVELLAVSHCARCWHVYHDRYAVCACGGGASSWRYRGQSLGYEAGWLGLMEPGEPHVTTHIYHPGEFVVLLVDPGVFKRAAEDQGLAGELHFRVAQLADPRFFGSIKALADAVQSGESPLEQQSRLVMAIRGALGCNERGCPPPSRARCGPALKLAMDCLHDHYREPVDLDDLATLTGLSKFTLVHAFTRQVGLPPHTYQNHIRVERARSLLELGITPAMAAVESGFADQSHFTRHFKEILHVTPGEYARATLGRPR